MDKEEITEPPTEEEALLTQKDEEAQEEPEVTSDKDEIEDEGVNKIEDIPKGKESEYGI